MAVAKRRLAAILSADVAGYSRLMGLDERATVAALNDCRAIFRAEIGARGARVVDTAGDSVLAIFDSVVEAVDCAMALQPKLAKRDTDLSEERRMRFRIGVNVGDVIEQEDGTIYGDGVNIAARLEQLAHTGGVAVSEDAMRQVRGKLPYDFRDLGAQEVKNIAEPVRAFEVIAVDDKVQPVSTDSRPLTHGESTRSSLAILPFDNMSRDPDQEYFCDGIVEDLITAMSKFRELIVIARNSTFSYKGQAVNVAQVGRDLNVRYVVEGSVRRSGNRVRITAQLVEAATGNHLWADRFDRELADIFAVQDEITGSIAATLGHTLRSAGMAEARRASDAELDVWQLISRGSWHLSRYNKEANKIAEEFFRQATEKDPENASALAYLGNSLCLAVTAGWQTGKALEEAFSMAKRAVSADPENGMAHACLGFCYWVARNRVEAERNFFAALSLNPNDAFSYYLMAFSKAMAGDRDATFDNLGRAQRLSPRDPFMAALVPYIKCAAEYFGGELDAALPWAEQAVEVYPMRGPALRLYLAVCSELGMEENVRAYVAEHAKTEPGFTYEEWSARFPAYNESDRLRMRAALKAAGVTG
jgi:adenylate cyclase